MALKSSAEQRRNSAQGVNDDVPSTNSVTFNLDVAATKHRSDSAP